MESTSRERNQPIRSGSENPHRTESAERIETHPGSLSPRPPHGEWIFFRAHDLPAHATIPATYRHHRMHSTRPTRSYASNQNATSLPSRKKSDIGRPPGPAASTRNSGQMPGISQIIQRFVKAFAGRVASRKQAPGRYPFASICHLRPVSPSRRAGAGHPRPSPFRSQRQKYMPRRSRISASCWMALKAPCCAACSAAACARTRSASGVCFSSTAMSSTSNR